MDQYQVKGYKLIKFTWPPYYAKDRDQAIEHAVKHEIDADIESEVIFATESKICYYEDQVKFGAGLNDTIPEKSN
jgi:hypothetical protein